MCFSATASFIAGASLSALGVATVKKAQRKAEVPFAMIPLLFGVQQFIEGMLWLSFRFDAPLLNVTMTYAFTLFSHVLWPIFVPLSIGLVETVAWRKKVISAFQIIGITVGLYLLYLIVRFPVTSEVDEHIVYVLPHFYKVPVMALYLAATCVVSFFSSHKLINVFGVLALLLFMVAYWFYTVAFFSVWCFFAAILSAVIYLHFRLGKQRTPGLMPSRA
ncbi:MAG TPA: DUF6629 family protein [Novimethylophilus sp.]|jgi:hypothetical protein|uniref:DUF6629 family protein n=1 Tax=Novimethylophilus sp. TaxID=2137426 RepID=UPI002F40923A